MIKCTFLAALTCLMLFATPVVAASDPPVQSAEVVFWQSISSALGPKPRRTS